jgi:hypothetical protein
LDRASAGPRAGRLAGLDVERFDRGPLATQGPHLQQPHLMGVLGRLSRPAPVALRGNGPPRF